MKNLVGTYEILNFKTKRTDSIYNLVESIDNYNEMSEFNLALDDKIEDLKELLLEQNAKFVEFESRIETELANKDLYHLEEIFKELFNWNRGRK